MRITVTAFDAFGGLSFNSSEAMLRELAWIRDGIAPAELETLVLPTSYRMVNEPLRALLRPSPPNVLLMTGMAMGVEAVHVETVARNLDACAAPDNTGDVRLNRPIRADGPDYYLATIDARAVCRALTAAGISAVLSSDAGGFVCNHAFYLARDQIAQGRLTTQCGFLHLPGPDNWSAASLLSAVRISVELIIQTARKAPEDS